MSYFHQLMILCPLIFFSGFVDSIAGGGALISLPAYYAVGLPPHMVLGSNKLSACLGCTTSTIRFVRSKSYSREIILPSVISALIGSALGARLAIYLSPEILQYILIISLPILAVFIITRKDIVSNKKMKSPSSAKSVIIRCTVIGFGMGIYDGFFGPGTGTFLILLFTSVVGLELLSSMGNAKIVNLSTNIAAIGVFLLYGQINFYLAVPAAICAVLGNYIGSGLAIKNGKKIVRPMLIVVLALLLLKIIHDMFI